MLFVILLKYMKIRTITEFLPLTWPLDTSRIAGAGRFLTDARLRFSDAGFEVKKIQRVQYPWHEEMTNAPAWLEAPYPWDWLVLARRPD